MQDVENRLGVGKKVSRIMMPLGALLMSLMIGWEVGPEMVKAECEQSGHAMSGYGFFKVCHMVFHQLHYSMVM